MEPRENLTSSTREHAHDATEALPITGTAPLALGGEPSPVAMPGKIVFHRPIALTELPIAVAVPGRIVFHQRTRSMHAISPAFGS